MTIAKLDWHGAGPAGQVGKCLARALNIPRMHRTEWRFAYQRTRRIAKDARGCCRFVNCRAGNIVDSDDVERILHQSAEAVFALLHFAVLAQQFLDAFEKAGFQLIFNTK